jgi:hypothetical protein
VNTGSQGFSRTASQGFSVSVVHVLRLWIRFVRQDLVCVHSDGIDSSLIIWVYFYSGSPGDTVHTFLCGSFA